MNKNSSGLKRNTNTISEMIRIESLNGLQGSVKEEPEFISKLPSETDNGLKVKSESEDEGDNEEESGLGLAVGMSFGVAIGAALDNIALYMMIGLTLGILVDARMGSGKNKG